VPIKGLKKLQAYSQPFDNRRRCFFSEILIACDPTPGCCGPVVSRRTVWISQLRKTGRGPTTSNWPRATSRGGLQGTDCRCLYSDTARIACTLACHLNSSIDARLNVAIVQQAAATFVRRGRSPIHRPLATNSKLRIVRTTATASPEARR